MVTVFALTIASLALAASIMAYADREVPQALQHTFGSWRAWVIALALSVVIFMIS